MTTEEHPKCHHICRILVPPKQFRAFHILLPLSHSRFTCTALSHLHVVGVLLPIFNAQGANGTSRTRVSHRAKSVAVSTCTAPPRRSTLLHSPTSPIASYEPHRQTRYKNCSTTYQRLITCACGRKSSRYEGYYLSMHDCSFLRTFLRQETLRELK